MNGYKCVIMAVHVRAYNLPLDGSDDMPVAEGSFLEGTNTHAISITSRIPVAYMHCMLF